jgi:hypothetical protein
MIINQNIKSFLLYLLFVSVLFKLSVSQAQIRNGSDLYIGDNSLLYVDVETFDFGVGTMTTSRTTSNYGVFALSSEVSWLGASDTHFVDGYVRTHSTKTFVLPVGQSGIYAPIKVTPTSDEGVEAAYYRSPATSLGTVFEEGILSISSVEYWDIKSNGVNAEISLSYSSKSDIPNLTSSSLTSLSIIGYNGYQWVAIPSTVDENSIRGKSSLFSGSISSNAEVDLSAFSAFSLGSKTTDAETVAKGFSSKINLTTYISANRLHIEASSRISAIEIYDMTGKKIVYENVNGEYNHETPLPYEEAIYVAMVKFDNGLYRTKKIMNRISR